MAMRIGADVGGTFTDVVLEVDDDNSTSGPTSPRRGKFLRSGNTANELTSRVIDARLTDTPAVNPSLEPRSQASKTSAGMPPAGCSPLESSVTSPVSKNIST